MVHRPFRLAEIIRVLSAHQLEPKRMQLVYPYVDREPNMVLIEAVRGGRATHDGGEAADRVRGSRVYIRERLRMYMDINVTDHTIRMFRGWKD